MVGSLSSIVPGMFGIFLMSSSYVCGLSTRVDGTAGTAGVVDWAGTCTREQK